MIHGHIGTFALDFQIIIAVRAIDLIAGVAQIRLGPKLKEGIDIPT